MILELLGRKLINISTPYKRIFISAELEEENLTVILPGVKSATFFLNNKDLLIINDIDEIENLCYIDYDLINNNDKTYKKFFDDFQLFKEIVKKELMTNNSFSMEIEKKVIFSEVLHITCKILKNKF